MRLSNPLFLIAAMALAIGGIAYFSNRPEPHLTVVQGASIEPTPTAQTKPDTSGAELQAVAAQLNAARARWDDSVKLAKVTPRIQLAGVVAGMQQQAHDLDALIPTLPACPQAAARHLRESQQATLDMLLAFMGSDMEALAQSTKSDPEPPMRSFETSLQGCLPG